MLNLQNPVSCQRFKKVHDVDEFELTKNVEINKSKNIFLYAVKSVDNWLNFF